MYFFQVPAVVLALIAQLNLFSFFMVDGPSMEPTLQSGQVFILDQFSYGVAKPKRGDIVVFNLADKPDYFYVKRIVGLPGEKISVNNDGVYLHFAGGGEEKLDESYLGPVTVSTEDALRQSELSLINRSNAEKLYLVPMDKYFVLGDNRTHSLDSRYFRDSYVSKPEIKGKYLFTLF
ncbi:signal peptidase I [Candidatus Gracilibacteria bacterium]|nr:signal peptidase I [Candidatus Gracilibacteria bacterium]